MKIEVSSRGEEKRLEVNPGLKLLDFLQEAEISVNAACGGKGTCHKCRVQIQEGFAAVTATDRKAFQESELQKGWRLSCQCVPRTNLKVQVPEVESFKAKARLKCFESIKAQSPHRLICDLGSTGIVLALINAKGELMAESHLLNRQVRFGADVMTRLQAAQERGVGILQNSIMESLDLALLPLEEKYPDLLREAKNKPAYCSGNSAMTSFLHGWDITHLAVSPFQPAKLDVESTTFNGWTYTSLPLLAGFVGADTVAGILDIEKNRVPQDASTSWMLVDIGTNTEIVFKTKSGHYWFTSAPAGPAFEGGNISQGMRAEPGALAHAWYESGQWRFESIGQDVLKGLCGSGLIDVLFESVKSGLITRDGYVPGGRLILNESLSLLADDIREFQLAKGATCAAAETLMLKAKARPDVIYLAGTFAENIRLDALAGVGLLPSGVPLKQIGNASLRGSILYSQMSDEQQKLWVKNLRAHSEQVELALEDEFQDVFVKALNF